MYTCHKFAANLSAIREMRKLSIAEFSQELEVPKSTLQNILSKDGDTTLHTALLIANRLGLPLDTLTGEECSSIHPKLLLSIMTCLDCFVKLPEEDQVEVAFHIGAIMDKVQK